MDAFHETNVLVLVKEHFSKATDGDGRLVWDDVKGYGFEDAKRAIEEHRREKGSQAWRPDPGRIRALAATFYRERRREQWDAARVVDVLRRQDRDGLLHGLEDVDAVEAHFTTAWGMVDAPDGIGRNVARAYILNGARTAFGEVGLSRSESERKARECVGLAPGEKIPRARLFQPDPESPPTSYEALKQLAVAEYGSPNQLVGVAK